MTTTDSDTHTDVSERFDWRRRTENGFERCVWCGVVFGAEHRTDDIRNNPGVGGGLNYTYGPVFDHDGTEYEYVGASAPDSYLLHSECYTEYHAEIASERNHSLQEFATPTERNTEGGA